MACGSCGGGLPQNDYLVTYKDGSTKVFTVYAAARIEAGKNAGATVKAVPRK